MVVDAVLQDDAVPIVGDFVTAPAGRAPSDLPALGTPAAWSP